MEGGGAEQYMDREGWQYRKGLSIGCAPNARVHTAVQATPLSPLFPPSPLPTHHLTLAVALDGVASPGHEGGGGSAMAVVPPTS